MMVGSAGVQNGASQSEALPSLSPKVPEADDLEEFQLHQDNQFGVKCPV